MGIEWKFALPLEAIVQITSTSEAQAPFLVGEVKLPNKRKSAMHTESAWAILLDLTRRYMAGIAMQG